MLTENIKIKVKMDVPYKSSKVKSNYMLLKRYFDLFLIFISFPVILIIFVFFAFILFFHFNGKIFFTQKRIGFKGKPFIIYKFKTMTDSDVDGKENIHHCSNRETKFGTFLRIHRIDEIPQIINVIKGDMSLVGPRPEAYYHYEYFSEIIESYKHRKCVPPGLTGLAQISYPYTDTIEGTVGKLTYDFEYISNFSFKSDLIIIIRTFIQIFTGKSPK